jgi:hypothetical protein
VGAVSLATRLLLALAYVLVLAIVALEVPLALSVRDRVDAEVRSQARGSAELVAATVSGRLDHPAEVRCAAAPHRSAGTATRSTATCSPPPSPSLRGAQCRARCASPRTSAPSPAPPEMRPWAWSLSA